MRRLALVALLLVSCSTGTPDAGPSAQRPPSSAAVTRAPVVPSRVAVADWWRPKTGVSWQWQLSGPLDLTVDAQVYDVDLFTTTAAQVRELHSAGRRAVCYLDAGSWEPGRPDSSAFAPAVLGTRLAGFPDERWLDIRRSDLFPVLARRTDLCRTKGFDGVEFDNVDGYANATGFPLTAADQLRFNRALATMAHERGLAAALKNDLEQVPALQAAFDFSVDEQCAQYDECALLTPFIAAGKPVLHVEYDLAPALFCPVTRPLGFSSLAKNLSLDSARVSC